MQLIDGKALARQIRDELASRVKMLPDQPRLQVMLVGHDPASEIYVALKEKAALEAGIAIEVARLAADTPDEQLIEQLKRWNQDKSVHAILVQLPLPAGHDEDRVIQAIDPRKDVDGFHPEHLEAMREGSISIIPPVVEGCLRLLNQADLTVNGSRVVVIANSSIFALPFERLLKVAGAFVTVMQPDELNRQVLATADAVVIAIGRPEFLNRSMTKRDAVIIDVGTNRLDDGRVVGDVDLKSYEETEAKITPVPGGVGPMTIAMLLKNVIDLASRA